MAATTTHEIVILGANLAGMNLIHYLLRQTIPILSRVESSQSYHVTLVSPNSHFYFKIAGPRALINDTLIPEEKIFKSIPKAVSQYGNQCTFIQGKAVGLDPKKKTVKIEQLGSSGKELRYDSLFICTGTTSASPLWTIHEDHKNTIKALQEMHSLLPNAKSVLIAGGGPVGVETAGEISANYPSAKVTLVAGGDVLERLKPNTITKAKKFLSDAKVEVITNVRVNGSSPLDDGTKVDLSDGSSKTADVFVDARGAHKINSQFLPDSWLDRSGRVETLDSYFRVKGDGQSDVSNTYVIGDIVSGSTNTAIELDAQVPVAASSFAVDVTSKLGQSVDSGGGLLSWIPGLGPKSVAQKEFKPMKDTILVPVGPTGGVGQVMGWQMPSFMVKKAKAEKFLVELVEPAITGSKYGKA